MFRGPTAYFAFANTCLIASSCEIWIACTVRFASYDGRRGSENPKIRGFVEFFIAYPRAALNNVPNAGLTEAELMSRTLMHHLEL